MLDVSRLRTSYITPFAACECDVMINQVCKDMLVGCCYDIDIFNDFLQIDSSLHIVLRFLARMTGDGH